MKTKELVGWVNDMNNMNNGVYIGINGGGVSFYTNGEFEINPSIYSENAEQIFESEVMDDFKSIMSEEEYMESKFFVIRHKTGYNQENMDIQIAYYE